MIILFFIFMFNFRKKNVVNVVYIMLSNGIAVYNVEHHLHLSEVYSIVLKTFKNKTIKVNK